MGNEREEKEEERRRALFLLRPPIFSLLLLPFSVSLARLSSEQGSGSEEQKAGFQPKRNTKQSE